MPSRSGTGSGWPGWTWYRHPYKKYNASSGDWRWRGKSSTRFTANHRHSGGRIDYWNGLRPVSKRRTGSTLSTATTATTAVATTTTNAPTAAVVVVRSEGERVKRFTSLQSPLHGDASVQLRTNQRQQRTSVQIGQQQTQRIGNLPNG